MTAEDVSGTLCTCWRGSPLSFAGRDWMAVESRVLVYQYVYSTSGTVPISGIISRWCIRIYNTSQVYGMQIIYDYYGRSSRTCGFHRDRLFRMTPGYHASEQVGRHETSRSPSSLHMAWQWAVGSALVWRREEWCVVKDIIIQWVEYEVLFTCVVIESVYTQPYARTPPTRCSIKDSFES